MDTPPDEDQVEVSIFGPGFGECVVCHLGRDRWMVVDSCLHPETNSPVAIEYLKSIGRDPSKAIVTVVCSHWHNDHIKGLNDVLRAAPNAEFFITAAVQLPALINVLKSWIPKINGINGAGVSELIKIIECGRKPKFAKDRTLVYQEQSPCFCQVRALSPSDGGLAACIADVAELGSAIGVTLPNMKENHSSVALSVQVADRHVLLGADLEVKESRDWGWLAVVDSHLHGMNTKHTVFKVAHHGSPNGDHAEIWEHMLVPAPFAIVTPFNKSKRPRPGDLERIKCRTNKGFQTSGAQNPPDLHSDPEIAEIVRRFRPKAVASEGAFGQVRLRGRLGEPPDHWSVSLFGNASYID